MYRVEISSDGQHWTLYATFATAEQANALACSLYGKIAHVRSVGAVRCLDGGCGG